jgi:hypothetical protein
MTNLEQANYLLNNVEVLSQAERDLCFEFQPELTEQYLFHNFWNGTYLNLNVYSEVDKEAHDLEREVGY